VSKGDTFETNLLKLIFQNITIANIGDATGIVGSGTAGSLNFGIHTADPGEAGNQTTSEISYTGYGRVAVARSTGGFTVSGNSVSPASTVSFGQMTAGTGGTATHFHVGASNSGTGQLLYSGTISPNITVNNGVTPQLTTSTAFTED
jgi:hypothetical protein